MKRLLIALVQFYRRYISPLKPPCCRFIPTCSEYALEALQKYGALKGSWLAVKRICRCDDAASNQFMQNTVKLHHLLIIR